VDKNGNVYLTDPTGFRVLVFGPDGSFKMTFGDLGTDEKSFQLPIGIAVDDNGNVYVSDAALSRVLRFTGSDLNIK
jgi:sugar lactone lactonase YvrE